MRSVKRGMQNISLLLGALSVLAWPTAAARAQSISTADIIEKLASDEEVNIDLAALRQQAAERIKARVDAQPQKRPPIAPQLSKLPQVRFDIVFDPDSSLVRPASYQTVGSIADALTDPKLRPYRYLIVDHVESAGRRDHNLILSQRRAEFDPGCADQHLQGGAEAAAGAWPRRGTVAGYQSSGRACQCARPDHRDRKVRDRTGQAGNAGRASSKGRCGEEEEKLNASGWISAEGPQPDFATLDQSGTKVAAVNDTTAMRALSAVIPGRCEASNPESIGQQ